MPDHTDDPDDQLDRFRDIRPGDIVHDIGQPGWPRMWVIRQECATVHQYIDRRDTDLREFEKNALSGTDLNDRVFLVTYLRDSPYSVAHTHYAMPASRLAKQDLLTKAEHVADDHDPVRHPADQAVFDFLTQLLVALRVDDAHEHHVDTVVDHAYQIVDDRILIDNADDLAGAIAADQDAGRDEQDQDGAAGEASDLPDFEASTSEGSHD